MTKTKSKKAKYNSKITKVKCLHCDHTKPVQRENAIYCSPLCRVQERNYREKIGMAKLFIETTFEELRKEFVGLWLLNTSFQKDFVEIATAFGRDKPQENWKYLNASNRFIIYYTPNSKTKNFKLYYYQELDKKYKEIRNRAQIRNSYKATFRYVG